MGRQTSDLLNSRTFSHWAAWMSVIGRTGERDQKRVGRSSPRLPAGDSDDALFGNRTGCIVAITFTLLGFVEEPDARISNERGGHGKALLLASREFANPSIRLLGEFEFVKNFAGSARFAVETGEKLDGFADVQLRGQAGFLKRDTDPFP